MKTRCETCKHRRLMDLDSVSGYVCRGFEDISSCFKDSDKLNYTCERYEFSLVNFIADLLKI